jgi:hypothetical protein
MKFLTQAFSRGFFRNPDVRPAKLQITKFQPSQDQHPYVGSTSVSSWHSGKGNCQNLPRYPSPFPEGTTEWFMDECQRLRAPIESARNDKPYAGVTVRASVPLLAPRERPLTIGECIARLRALP